ncbi:hypothetical protein AKJ38_00945 [candidate division MSBL1 archaeon SCGC-AAA259I14]|uniref:Uncharacterized protein n=1 Tax=candidate division MSBL1 archaeon SCGC-AAA259I14 TaxID=1698268 RepID=A0A133UTF9_9EURY|nr:hypothetical protein AKJ38_00945 [candidate division MSBL1 archaeon SCGC-AAA259I14]
MSDKKDNHLNPIDVFYLAVLAVLLLLISWWLGVLESMGEMVITLLTLPLSLLIVHLIVRYDLFEKIDIGFETRFSKWKKEPFVWNKKKKIVARIGIPLVVLSAMAVSGAWLIFLRWIGSFPWPVMGALGLSIFFGTMFLLAMGLFRALQLWGRED